MATKKNPPTIKAATKPFMAPGFNPPKKGKTNDVSSGKGFDLVKDKMRAQVSKVKKQVRSSTVSRGSANIGGGTNICKSKNKF